MLQPYLFKQKKGSHMYMILFKWLLSVVIHSSITYWIMPNTNGTYPMINSLRFKFLYRNMGTTVPHPEYACLSTKHPPKRLIEHHFLEQVPTTINMVKPRRRYVICSKTENKEK